MTDENWIVIALALRVVTAAWIGIPDTDAWGMHLGAEENGKAVAKVTVHVCGEPDPTVIVPMKLLDALVSEGDVPQADRTGFGPLVTMLPPSVRLPGALPALAGPELPPAQAEIGARNAAARRNRLIEPTHRYWPSRCLSCK